MIIKDTQADQTQEVSENLDTLLAEIDRQGSQVNLLTGLNIVQYDTVTYGSPSTFFGGQFASIDHGLGYTPVVKVWLLDGGRYYLTPFIDIIAGTINYALSVTADSQSIYFSVNLGAASSITATFTLRYYIFRDPVG